MKKVNFEILKPNERLLLIRECKKDLIKMAIQNELNFSILITGSTQYGFNSSYFGRLNDVDCIGILPDHLEYKDFINKLTFEQEDFPTENDFKYFMSEDNENTPSVLRISGLLNGIKVSIHLSKYKTLINVLNNLNYKIYNLIPKDHERLIHTNSRFEVLGIGKQIIRNPRIRNYKFDNSKILIEECIFKKIEVKSESLIVKGALGDKLLISDVEYLYRNENIEKLLKLVWIQFSKLSKQQYELINQDNLVNSIVRSKFFNSEFNKSIKKKADFYLDLISNG